jgi:hypothetical protein
MKPPNWQKNFRDLPTIPEHKLWKGNGEMTVEQIISLKLLSKQMITSQEESIFKSFATFYSELNEKLKTLDYSSFSDTDFENFKNYIFYAFNYNALITNNLTILQTSRLVVNEWVTNHNQSIININYLKYPSLEIVKKANKFNRANTPNTNVFYSAENIDTALKETKPPLNKLVTVGVWKPKVSNKQFISYPISHSDVAEQINEGVAKATKAFEDHGNFNSSLFLNYMRYYFQLLGREFTKKVSHHFEYYISSLFSERILKDRQEQNDGSHFHYDCIIYPSVGNGFETSNVAIRPQVLDNDFYLEKVVEFEIEQAFYDKPYVLSHPEDITFAKIKNLRLTNKVDNHGNIKWD